ncbi:efflux transporter outer membrane subunit [Janthinobacterium lividum]|uniref:efflux transporter outer membrane subunit n=1 Tax=Janthinobacterium lividum TaxID=29581 RepID=UPI0008753195|nr:efflux transporter outer membrane subunit [Janthinobacterium lividum]MCC7712555.1 efflux transporter outer membrane subunit [Janthinobacterium lividum]OEZ56391.1 outer membrane protein OprM precursor [Janthinobacterium lividum]WQE26774.1 efflux transporter outer membrane subunit [Janthinobacterium lividum]STQ97661.1 Outer membrane protein oprM precursor [Janthinobacterium lividum]
MSLPRLRLRLPFLLFAASLAAGCTAGADYRRPELPHAAQYPHRAALGARAGANTADAAELRQWWTAFGDPRLTHLVTVALAQNLDLAQAQARVRQARAATGAADAALLPSASLGGQAARAYQSVQTPLGQVLDATPGHDRAGSARELNLQASWELDLFGGLRREREAARADYEASEAGWAATRLAVAAQTADLYLSIQGLQARLDLARRQVDTEAALLELATLLYDKGLLNEPALRQAEASLAQARAVVPGLDTAREVALHALDVMLGAAPGTYGDEMAAAGVMARAPRITADGAPGELLRRRPDLIAAERRLAAASARTGAAVAEYYPKLSLGALFGSATSGGALFGSGSGQAAGMLGLRWRLFDFGRIDAQIEASRGREAELLAAYRLAALHAAEDVENACSALLRHEEQAALLAQSVQAFERARAAALAAYEKGVVSRLDVLQADTRLLRAADARAQAQTASARAAVATYRALGGGWQAPQAETEAMAAR